MTAQPVVGAKYRDFQCDAASIVRAVRDDLRAAALPRFIAGHKVTYNVRGRRFSQGQCVDVVIRGIPEAVAQLTPPSCWSTGLTSEVRELKTSVWAIANAYNREPAHSHHPMYYLDVRLERDVERAVRAPRRPRLS